MEGLRASQLTWNWEPSVLIGLALLNAGYFLVQGLPRRRFQFSPPTPLLRQLAFFLGNFCVFIALISPLDQLADDYLFSAHMIQHILLTFIAPPLWLLGMPPWLVERLIPAGTPRRLWSNLTRPLTAYLLFNITMWAWHIPAAYDAALEHEGLHVFEHLTFMATAIIGWWPVLGPSLTSPRPLSSPGKAFYLFLSTFPCTALAALITLSPSRLYSFYGEAPLSWNLSPLWDQQLGGLLMWLPVDMILMALALGFLYTWLNNASIPDPFFEIQNPKEQR